MYVMYIFYHTNTSTVHKVSQEKIYGEVEKEIKSEHYKRPIDRLCCKSLYLKVHNESLVYVLKISKCFETSLSCFSLSLASMNQFAHLFLMEPWLLIQSSFQIIFRQAIVTV